MKEEGKGITEEMDCEWQAEKVRKKNVERKGIKSGRNELRKERKGYKEGHKLYWVFKLRRYE